MARLKIAMLICVFFLSGVLGLVLFYQGSQEGSSGASFKVQAGFSGTESKILDGTVNFTLQQNTNYKLSITVINNGAVRLTDIIIELTEVPEGFSVPKTKVVAGSLSENDAVGYGFDITTSSTYGNYQMKLKISCKELTRIFHILLVIQ